MKAKNKTDLIKRYALFLVGLFIASMGVVFSTKAGLGTSPVASLPYKDIIGFLIDSPTKQNGSSKKLTF